jgi:NAD(P)-dependent dehydrogenase (short-subunit alcohol dehydrogenase family)
MEITNKTVLVTGANRGIGRAFVTALLERGAAQVYATARDPHRLVELADGRVTPLRLDVTSDQQIRAAVERVERLDILVNNAGVLIPDDLIAGDLDLGVVQRQLDVNYLGPLRLSRAFLPRLEQAGGAVINVLSLLAIASMPLTPAYASSKAAAFSMTQALRAHLAPKGVAVHAVFPGPVDTDMARNIPPEVPKAAPVEVVRAILEAVEAGEEDIFPDPMSRGLYEVWHTSPSKALERQFAAFAGTAS